MATVWRDLALKLSLAEKSTPCGEGEILSRLQNNILYLHQTLLGNPDYVDQLQGRNRLLARNKYWGWRTYHEDARGRIGLFVTYDNAPVPLHDHPGAQGLIIVLAGEVELERYTLCEHDGLDQTSDLAGLELDSRRYLRPHDMAWFSPVQGNIQGLRSLTGECLLLKVQVQVGQPLERSWFFPLVTNAGRVSARRIRSA